MNWKWIVVVLLGFVVVFHLVIVMYVSSQRYELTSPDYYRREIEYQQIIDKKEAAGDFEWNWQLTGRQAELSVIGQSGRIELAQPVAQLYKPDQSRLDRQVAVTTMQPGQYRIDFTGLPAGLWHVTIEAQVAGRAMIFERSVSLP